MWTHLHVWFYIFTWSHGRQSLVLCISLDLPSCKEMLLCRNDRLLPEIWHIRLFVLSQQKPFFIPVGRYRSLFTRLPHAFATKRDTYQVILLFIFSPNRAIGEFFESAVGFLMAPHINSEEPVLLSHMVQHPLINATQCCVTKSQLHHAFYDWSALTVVDGI